MGMLPGRDRKVIGIPSPSSSKKVKRYVNKTIGKYGSYGRSFSNSVIGRK